MKAISLWQPWATLIAIGAKKIETRSWSLSYRGEVAIHAVKKWDRTLNDLCSTEPFRSVLTAAGYEPQKDLTGHETWELPHGAIVALARVTDVYEIGRKQVPGGVEVALSTGMLGGRPIGVTDQERAFGDYGIGRFGWQLSEVRRLRTPMAWGGHQGLFEFPSNLVSMLRFV